jgi:hypothetical protein
MNTSGASASGSAEAIELRIERIEQLFDTLDPFPFHEKALDPSAEEYIVAWARALGRDHPLRIVIHLPSASISPARQQEISRAFATFFEYRAGVVAGDLRHLFRVGRRSLLIGIMVMVTCIMIAEVIPSDAQTSAFGRILQQSILILGWVANWRPLEIFLYDWWPLAARRNLYLRLAAAPLDFQNSP